jgi:hypothetical protein
VRISLLIFENCNAPVASATVLNSDIEISRKDAKARRMKGKKNMLLQKFSKPFHQFGEFSFAEISQNNFAALRLCVRLNRILATVSQFAFPHAFG